MRSVVAWGQPQSLIGQYTVERLDEMDGNAYRIRQALIPLRPNGGTTLMFDLKFIVQAATEYQKKHGFDSNMPLTMSQVVDVLTTAVKLADTARAAQGSTSV